MTHAHAHTIVEDLFLTDTFLIKGKLANKYQRLGAMLEQCSTEFLQIEDAAMVSLCGDEVIRSPRVLVNPSEVILAHELIDVAGDEVYRNRASNDKQTRIRAFYNGAVQLELSGRIDEKAYQPENLGGRRYFIMEDPVIRGVRTDAEELSVLEGLPYAIVRKERLSYLYDFT
jgi:hypothetical protein